MPREFGYPGSRASGHKHDTLNDGAGTIRRIGLLEVHSQLCHAAKALVSSSFPMR